MNEEKVFVPQNKRETFISLAMVLMLVYWLVKDLVPLINTGAYDRITPGWIFFKILWLYLGFVAIHLAPQKVEFIEDEFVRITFILRNSITIRLADFNISGNKNLNGEWSGMLRAKGRNMFFSSQSFPEFEKYLNNDSKKSSEQNEDNVYVSRGKQWLVCMIMGIVGFGFAIGWNLSTTLNSHPLKDNVFFWIFVAAYTLYVCFLIIHLFPKKVKILEDGSMCIIFALGNSVKLEPGKFKLRRMKNRSLIVAHWSGFIFVRGRFMIFNSGTFPEFEKYLVE